MLVVESTEIMKQGGAGQQASARHRGDVTNSMGQPLVTSIGAVQSVEQVPRRTECGRYDDARMLDGAVWIKQLRPDHANIADGEPTGHSIEPTGRDRLDVVV